MQLTRKMVARVSLRSSQTISSGASNLVLDLDRVLGANQQLPTKAPLGECHLRRSPCHVIEILKLF